jgi:hypothetical protein
MANETLNYCDLGPAIIGEEKFKELNRSQGGVGGGSDLGTAFLSPPEPEPVQEEEPAEAEAPKAAKKRAR